MAHKINLMMAAVIGLGMASIASAQNVPYEYDHQLGGANKRSNARLIVAARLHREVEVSRSLAAQPVHPHMARVVLGGEFTTGSGSVSGQIQTYIDPLRKLDGHRGLDHNHSLVKAQRLHLALTGMTTEQLHAVRSQSEAAELAMPRANQARIVVAPQRDTQTMMAMPKPLMIIPVPNQGAPQEYKPQDKDGKLLATTD